MLSEPVPAPGAPRRQRLLLAGRSAGRGLLWAILAVSLFGTASTAVFLPYPLSAAVVWPSIAGALCSGLVALFRLFVASVSFLALAPRQQPYTSRDQS